MNVGLGNSPLDYGPALNFCPVICETFQWPFYFQSLEPHWGDGFLPNGRIYVSYEGVEFVRWKVANWKNTPQLLDVISGHDWRFWLLRNGQHVGLKQQSF